MEGAGWWLAGCEGGQRCEGDGPRGAATPAHPWPAAAHACSLCPATMPRGHCMVEGVAAGVKAWWWLGGGQGGCEAGGLRGAATPAQPWPGAGLPCHPCPALARCSSDGGWVGAGLRRGNRLRGAATVHVLQGHPGSPAHPSCLEGHAGRRRWQQWCRQGGGWGMAAWLGARAGERCEGRLAAERRRPCLAQGRCRAVQQPLASCCATWLEGLPALVEVAGWLGWLGGCGEGQQGCCRACACSCWLDYGQCSLQGSTAGCPGCWCCCPGGWCRCAVPVGATRRWAEAPARPPARPPTCLPARPPACVPAWGLLGPKPLAMRLWEHRRRGAFACLLACVTEAGPGPQAAGSGINTTRPLNARMKQQWRPGARVAPSLITTKAGSNARDTLRQAGQGKLGRAREGGPTCGSAPHPPEGR